MRGVAALIPVNAPVSVAPSGENVRPASSESTVVPASPSATTRLVEASPTARSLAVDGLTVVHAPPPLVVRSRRSPETVTATQVSVLAHAIDFTGGGASGSGCSNHVAPPSTVLSATGASPTAYPTFAVGNVSPRT